MSKYLNKLLLVFFLFLTACSLGNTPTSKVESMLYKYQTLDNDIKKDIDATLNTTDLNEEQYKKYKKLLEKQYQNLTYDVKEESIDNDVATITVEIKVLDYRKTVDRVENEYMGSSEYGTSSYIDYKLKELEKAKEKVTYTINFTCTKNENGNWELDNLTNLDKQKIEGMY